MKLLIIGCNGMVGLAVAMYLKEQGHDVEGYDSAETDLFPCTQGSLYECEKLQSCIENGAFDAVINCTAVINEDAENDKAHASYVNAYFPHWLEKVTAGTKTVVVHRSTDCIFSGARGQYTPEDIPDAQSFYARSKALGEIINEKDITIRTSLIGPDRNPNGSSLLSWFVNQEGSVNGFANAIWTGVTTIEFAREIELLLAEKASGLFQCVPEENAISKYDLLCLFEKYFPNGRTILRVENKRVDKSLVPWMKGSAVQIPSYEDMVAEMAHWIQEHKDIYSHY